MAAGRTAIGAGARSSGCGASARVDKELRASAVREWARFRHGQGRSRGQGATAVAWRARAAALSCRGRDLVGPWSAAEKRRMGRAKAVRGSDDGGACAGERVWRRRHHPLLHLLPFREEEQEWGENGADRWGPAGTVGGAGERRQAAACGSGPLAGPAASAARAGREKRERAGPVAGWAEHAENGLAIFSISFSPFLFLVFAFLIAN